ncbi:MAG: PAS domain S-box protein [Alphaproteobacteria bacterium]|nr:PAS domain S-box protein [Alphaproteobacteria bacterium]
MSDAPQDSQSFNEKQLRAILDNTVDGIIVIDSRGHIMSYNLACEKLFGYPPKDVLGKNVNILMPEPYKAQHDSYVGNYIRTREAKIIGIGREVVGARKDGTTFPMLLSIGEVIEEEGHFFVGIVRDITEHKNYEIELRRHTNALERSNSELDDFVYIVSHDLKEPVRGIYSYSQFLLEDYEKEIDKDGVNKLQSLMKLSKRMEDLIDTLLYYSRLGRTDLAFMSTDLNAILAGVLEMLDPVIKAENIEIKIETKLPTIVCDQARVGEIFRNLITNAIKYNKKEKKLIHLGMRTDYPSYEDIPVFYIKDNGIGIPEKHYESIFKMFKRLHGRDEYGGGTGSGLTIVKKIILRHGGKIWIDSQEDVGTTFYFTLR